MVESLSFGVEVEDVCCCSRACCITDGCRLMYLISCFERSSLRSPTPEDPLSLASHQRLAVRPRESASSPW